MHIQNAADLGAIRVNPRYLSDMRQLVGLGRARYVLRLVSQATGISESLLLAPNRGKAPVAFSRQLAMYLVHVALKQTMQDTGDFFGRDRTTVAHACGRIEDLRDDPENPGFEHLVSDLEKRVESVCGSLACILSVRRNMTDEISH